MAKNKRVITPSKGGRTKSAPGVRATPQTIEGIKLIVEWRRAHGQPKFTYADWLERAVRNEVEAIEVASQTAPQPAQKVSE